MKPERKCNINGYIIEEYLQRGAYVVYIDGKQTDYSYSEACNKASKKKNEFNKATTYVENKNVKRGNEPFSRK